MGGHCRGASRIQGGVTASEAALEPANQPLIEALQHEDAKVREAAARALEHIGAPEAKAALAAYHQ